MLRQPKIAVKKGKIEVLSLIFSFLLIIASWIIAWQRGFAGASLFSVITVAIITLGIWWLSKYPHLFNYPVKITTENAERQYRNALHFIHIFMLIFVVIFFVLTIETSGFANFDNATFIALIMSLTLLEVIFLITFIQKSFKLK